jgi:hypothetical protein
MSPSRRLCSRRSCDRCRLRRLRPPSACDRCRPVRPQGLPVEQGRVCVLGLQPLLRFTAQRLPLPARAATLLFGPRRERFSSVHPMRSQGLPRVIRYRVGISSIAAMIALRGTAVPAASLKLSARRSSQTRRKLDPGPRAAGCAAIDETPQIPFRQNSPASVTASAQAAKRKSEPWAGAVRRPTAR